jgi:hypothetical protein
MEWQCVKHPSTRIHKMKSINTSVANLPIQSHLSRFQLDKNISYRLLSLA